MKENMNLTIQKLNQLIVDNMVTGLSFFLIFLMKLANTQNVVRLHTWQWHGNWGHSNDLHLKKKKNVYLQSVIRLTGTYQSKS